MQKRTIEELAGELRELAKTGEFDPATGKVQPSELMDDESMKSILAKVRHVLPAKAQKEPGEPGHTATPRDNTRTERLTSPSDNQHLHAVRATEPKTGHRRWAFRRVNRTLACVIAVAIAILTVPLAMWLFSPPGSHPDNKNPPPEIVILHPVKPEEAGQDWTKQALILGKSVKNSGKTRLPISEHEAITFSGVGTGGPIPDTKLKYKLEPDEKRHDNLTVQVFTDERDIEERLVGMAFFGDDDKVLLRTFVLLHRDAGGGWQAEASLPAATLRSKDGIQCKKYVLSVISTVDLTVADSEALAEAVTRDMLELSHWQDWFTSCRFKLNPLVCETLDTEILPR